MSEEISKLISKMDNEREEALNSSKALVEKVESNNKKVKRIEAASKKSDEAFKKLKKNSKEDAEDF